MGFALVLLGAKVGLFHREDYSQVPHRASLSSSGCSKKYPNPEIEFLQFSVMLVFGGFAQNLRRTQRFVDDFAQHPWMQ
jgi:hypothetical protein